MDTDVFRGRSGARPGARRAFVPARDGCARVARAARTGGSRAGDKVRPVDRANANGGQIIWTSFRTGYTSSRTRIRS